MRIKMTSIAVAGVLVCCLCELSANAGGVNPQWSIARQWNEETLQAISLASHRPTVHARNLYHVSVAMYDAWAAYDPIAHGVFHTEKQTATDVDLARREAISYAAYRLLKSRFVAGNGPNIAIIQANLDALFIALGYDPANTSTIGNSPAAVGNRVAAAVISASILDGSNQANNYAMPPNYYWATNQPMIPWMDGTNTSGQWQMMQANHWTPLGFDFLVLGNGELIPISVPPYITPHWKQVAPFAIWSNDQNSEGVYFDQGGPPLVGDAGQTQIAADLLARSASLDIDNPATIDISPAVYHNSPLGTYNHQGYGSNPITGKPYAPNIVLSADYHRALAEYWYDGSFTITAAGHWFVIANQVSDSPDSPLQWQGQGEPLDRLEWDLKMYLALGGALHDAAIAAWSSKLEYDSPRPISALRYMAEQGQSSDPSAPSYNTAGLPLSENLVRIVTLEDIGAGGELEELPDILIDPWDWKPCGIDDHVGELVVRAWTGGLVAGSPNQSTTLGPAPGHIYLDDAGWHIGDFELGVDDTPGQLNPKLALPSSIKLSELRIGQPGRDTDEYVEITGPPGASLDGVWFISIGFIPGPVPDGNGKVIATVNLHGRTIGDDGIFVIARSTCTLTDPDTEWLLENPQSSNSTHALVTYFTGHLGQELDYFDNGVIDVTPWASLIDCVATRYSATSPAGIYLGAPALGPTPASSQRQGVEWILATRWLPFQPWFWVSPPYAGHVSAHSAFARSAAEALADITGSEFFPNGLFTISIPKDSFKIERGPTQNLNLQWASYFDAADECGASRLWAGVEPTVSDLAGRFVGAATGPRAIIRANALFAGFARSPDIDGNGQVNVDDLLLLINQWGSPPGPHQAADINGDGSVDVNDLLLVINNWG